MPGVAVNGAEIVEHLGAPEFFAGSLEVMQTFLESVDGAVGVAPSHMKHAEAVETVGRTREVTRLLSEVDTNGEKFFGGGEIAFIAIGRAEVQMQMNELRGRVSPIACDSEAVLENTDGVVPAALGIENHPEPAKRFGAQRRGDL